MDLYIHIPPFILDLAVALGLACVLFGTRLMVRRYMAAVGPRCTPSLWTLVTMSLPSLLGMGAMLLVRPDGATGGSWQILTVTMIGIGTYIFRRADVRQSEPCPDESLAHQEDLAPEQLPVPATELATATADDAAPADVPSSSVAPLAVPSQRVVQPEVSPPLTQRSALGKQTIRTLHIRK